MSSQSSRRGGEYNILTLLLLNQAEGDRVWKAIPWEVMDRLHEKGMITNPASKNKSVLLTEEGKERAHTLFEKLFSVSKDSKI